MPDFLLSLGGNTGDRKTLNDEAVARLAALPGTSVTARSGYYRTAPVGPVQEQGWFLNTAVTLSTDMAKAALAAACREIEAALGRNRVAEIPWGPRPIDIDVIDPARPEERSFVLAPLADIAPSAVLAGETVADRLLRVGAAGVERLNWPLPPG